MPLRDSWCQRTTIAQLIEREKSRSNVVFLFLFFRWIGLVEVSINTLINI